MQYLHFEQIEKNKKIHNLKCSTQFFSTFFVNDKKKNITSKMLKSICSMEENILNYYIIKLNDYNLFVILEYQPHLQLPLFTITPPDPKLYYVLNYGNLVCD